MFTWVFTAVPLDKHDVGGNTFSPNPRIAPNITLFQKVLYICADVMHKEMDRKIQPDEFSVVVMSETCWQSTMTKKSVK